MGRVFPSKSCSCDSADLSRLPSSSLLFSSCAEITLIKGKIEEIELPVKEVDIIVSEVSPPSIPLPTAHSPTT